MAKVSTTTKTILITAITAAAVYIILTFILPPEVLVKRHAAQKTESADIQSSEHYDDESAKNSDNTEMVKSNIPALQMTNMFYSEGRQKTEQTEIISVPESDTTYNTNRFMFLGTMCTKGICLYMLKDTELDFVFGIPEFSDAEGFTMTAFDEDAQFIVITDGESDYKIYMQ